MKVGLDVGGHQDGCRRRRRRRERSSGACASRRAGVRMPSCATVLDAVRALAVDAGIDVGGDPIDRRRHPGSGRAGHRRVVHAVNLGVDELDLAAAVGARAGRAGARRERRQGRGARRRTRCTAGTGLDGATSTSAPGSPRASSTDGELWRGARGTAGEVGHISVDPNGPLCRCGQRGCIEALAGGGAIAERWGRPGALPVRDVFDAADAGDPLARELRAGLARGVAAGGARARADRGRRRRRARRGRDRARRPSHGGCRRRARGECRGIPVHALAAARASASSCCRRDRPPPRSAPRWSARPATPRRRSPMAEIVIVPDAAAGGALVADEIVRLIRDEARGRPRPRDRVDAASGLRGAAPAPRRASTSRACAGSRSTSTSASTRRIPRATAR